MELFLWLALIFAFSLILGMLLERIKIPWMFAPLFLGLLVNAFDLKTAHISDFEFVAKLGMYFMLFIIGFKLDIEEFKKLSKKILKSTLIINTVCSILGMLLVMSFGYPPMVALIAGIAMATVGEAVLVPILEEFKLPKTKLGTMIAGIGVFDDVFEVIAIILAATLVASGAKTLNAETIVLGLGLPVLLTLAFMYITQVRVFTRKRPIMEELLLIGLTLLFTYLAIGGMAGAEGMGAILAGISLRNLVPNKDLKKTEFALEMMVYGFFGPLFFSWVGMTVDIKSIIAFPLLTLAFYFVAMIAKIIASWLTTEKSLGIWPALVLGIALSVRFSTELVIAQFLFSNGIIDSALFTAIVVSSALATVINPFLMIAVLKKVKIRK